MRDWRGKKYWLLGASEGLGRSLAFTLSRVGAEVIVSDPEQAPLEALVDELPGRGRALSVDLSDGAALKAAAAEAGEIDGAVHLASAYWRLPLDGWDPDLAERMTEINYLGAARMVGAVLGPMRGRGSGHLVLTGSVVDPRLPGAGGFAASKAAVIALAESLRAELDGTGIEVQLVNPGLVRGGRADPQDLPDALLMDADDAARSYFEHMNGESFSRSLPWSSATLFRLERLLPDWAFRRVNRR